MVFVYYKTGKCCLVDKKQFEFDMQFKLVADYKFI